MKSGKMTFFRRRSYWTQFMWLGIMAVGCLVGIGYRSIALFVMTIISAFLGLNEYGRWSYKTNLVLCSIVAIAGTLAGAFTWLETASVFVLMCVTGGFVFNYRDSVRMVIPKADDFASDVAKGASISEVAWIAHDKLAVMLPDCKVFVAVTDGISGLYIPERDGGPDRAALRRRGGVVWKTFASGNPYRTGNLTPAKDMPLYRDARSIMAAPLYARGEKLGVIEIESRSFQAFSEDDIDRLCVLAYITAQPLYGFIMNEIRPQAMRGADVQ